MIPIPIPKEIIQKGEALGWQSQIIAGPSGDLTDDSIRPVDALVGLVPEPDGEGASLNINVLVEMEGNDMEKLATNGGRFWLTFVGAIVPFSMSIYDPEEQV